MGVFKLKACIRELCKVKEFYDGQAIELAQGPDVLVFDSNDLIHEALEKINPNLRNQDEQLEQLKQRSKEIAFERIELLAPTQKVIFFFDGGAARAKLLQQKERRIKRQLQNNQTENFRNLVTAGTSLMSSYESYFITIVQDLREMYPNIDFQMDGTWAEGEGEHKIRNYLRTLDKNLKVTIYGKDGDLLFISLLTGIDSMIFGGYGVPQRGHDFVLYHTKKIRENLTEKYCGNRENKFNVVFDICFMMLNLGNDYIRYPIPSITLGYQKNQKTILSLFDLYKNSNDYIVNSEYLKNCSTGREVDPNLCINLPFFINLLEEFNNIHYLNKQKMFTIKNVGLKNLKRFMQENNLNRSYECPQTNNFYKRDGRNDVQSLKRSWYHNICKINANNPNSIMTLCEEYWKTMIWSLVTYAVGVPDWHHTFEFHNAPFLDDFVQYLHQNRGVSWNISKSFDPYPMLTRLISILPVNTLGMLYPEKIKDIQQILQDCRVLLTARNAKIGGVPVVWYAASITNLQTLPQANLYKASRRIFEILDEEEKNRILHYSEKPEYENTILNNTISLEN